MSAAVIDQRQLKCKEIYDKPERECREHKQQHKLEQHFPIFLLQLLPTLEEIYYNGCPQ